MDKQNIIELTKKVYKLTLLFPKKEPLRYKIREIADDILASLICPKSAKEKNIAFSAQRELEVIDSYFEVAKWQNWLSYFDILEIQQDYAKIKDNLLKEIGKEEIQEDLNFNFFIPKPKEEIEPSERIEMAENAPKLDSRKEKILKVLEKTGKIQVGEIDKLFPDVSKRTIRRDFHRLVEQGIVERLGERNDTFYKIHPIK